MSEFKIIVVDTHEPEKTKAMTPEEVAVHMWGESIFRYVFLVNNGEGKTVHIPHAVIPANVTALEALLDSALHYTEKTFDVL